MLVKIFTELETDLRAHRRAFGPRYLKTSHAIA